MRCGRATAANIGRKHKAAPPWCCRQLRQTSASPTHVASDDARNSLVGRGDQQPSCRSPFPRQSPGAWPPCLLHSSTYRQRSTHDPAAIAGSPVLTSRLCVASCACEGLSRRGSCPTPATGAALVDLVKRCAQRIPLRISCAVDRPQSHVGVAPIAFALQLGAVVRIIPSHISPPRLGCVT